MGRYIWQKKDWPHFSWKSEELLIPLGEARKAQGRLIAQADFLGLETQANLLVDEVFTTSAIEGEKLNRDLVRSSVARRLGLPTAGLPQPQRNIDGLVEILMDATTNFEQVLTAERLWSWHAALFPTGYSGLRKIAAGVWRTDKNPMQVVSGPLGKEHVHFEAPPANRITKEMRIFFEWWAKADKNIDGLLRAGIAHLWLVTIHPFDDGNGRIARALTDMALAQDERTGRRLYSLSSQILTERNQYYDILEQTQKKGTDITQWLKWFLEMFARAISASEGTVKNAFLLAKFWQKNKHHSLNERQIKVLKKLAESEPDGFQGGLTNRKYVSLTKVSRETAKRDIADLEEKGILKRRGGKGRSISYVLNLDGI